jgi:excisionase family DNA binding protein
VTNLIPVSKAAALLGLTPRRVQALIALGKLPAQRIGRDYLIDPADIPSLQRRPPGRPKKI